MSSVENTFSKIKSQFNAEAAAGLDAVFQFDIDGNGYHLTVENSECVAASGFHDDPSVTLLMDEHTFGDVVSGETNGMAAFMAGRLKTEGDMMLATRLSDLFSL